MSDFNVNDTVVYQKRGYNVLGLVIKVKDNTLIVTGGENVSTGKVGRLEIQKERCKVHRKNYTYKKTKREGGLTMKELQKELSNVPDGLSNVILEVYCYFIPDQGSFEEDYLSVDFENYKITVLEGSYLIEMFKQVPKSEAEIFSKIGSVVLSIASKVSNKNNLFKLQEELIFLRKLTDKGFYVTSK